MRTSTPHFGRRVALIAAGLTLSAAVLGFTARPTPADSANPPKDAWLKKLTGKHKQIFDTPAHGDGIPLIHVLNYYDTYNKAYNVPDKDINTVTTFYGGITLYAVNDAMWSKYKIGEFLKANDASGQPFAVNPWRTSPLILGSPMPAASVEALQKRGAQFIVCNNALTIFSSFLANARGLQADAVYADLKANLLPDVELVPGMVVAIEQAQRAGMTYLRQ